MYQRLIKKILIPVLFFFSGALYSQNKSLPNFNKHVHNLFNNVSKSVVQIMVTGYGPQMNGTNSVLTKVQGTGSGFIVSSDGYVVTNAHVVKGAVSVKVRLSGLLNKKSKLNNPLGRLVQADIIGVNEMSDIAVVKLPDGKYPFLKFADSRNVLPGELVFAVGSPLGLNNSISMGIISAVDRQFSDSDNMLYLQTDAAINPGNSGGPLVNSEGGVIGVNTMIMSQSGGNEGIGFALPSNAADFVYKQLKEFGILSLGYIGIHTQTIDNNFAEGLNLPQDWGALISDVFPGSPAALAGLKIGDIVVSADGYAIENARQLKVAVWLKKENQKISLAVNRRGERLKIKIPILVNPDAAALLKGLINLKKDMIEELGCWGIQLDDEIRSILPGLRKKNGIIVPAILGSAVEGASGLLPGDVIYSVNNVPAYSIQIVKDAIAKVKQGAPIVLQIERGGILSYLYFDKN